MTIDDCIDWLYRLRSNVLIFMPNVWHKRMTDALTMAIDIIHKYQQIVQIYQKWNDVNDFSYNQAMSQIGEVIKDGNVD